MGSLKRHPLVTLKREKKIGCGGGGGEESSSTSLINSEADSQAATSFRPECCQAPSLLFLLKQLGWRIRSRWRQFLIRRRRCNARLNYDLRSYAQNFDDDRRGLHDRRSPFAP